MKITAESSTTSLEVTNEKDDQVSSWSCQFLQYNQTPPQKQGYFQEGKEQEGKREWEGICFPHSRCFSLAIQVILQPHAEAHQKKKGAMMD